MGGGEVVGVELGDFDMLVLLFVCPAESERANVPCERCDVSRRV